MMEEIEVILNWLESNYEVIVALAAMVISVWSLHLQREHNKLSAKPYLDFARRVLEHKTKLKKTLRIWKKLQT